MLRQRCKVTMDQGVEQYVRGMTEHGDLIFTHNLQDALILVNHHWSELIKRNEDLQDMKPHLEDVE